MVIHWMKPTVLKLNISSICTFICLGNRRKSVEQTLTPSCIGFSSNLMETQSESFRLCSLLLSGRHVGIWKKQIMDWKKTPMKKGECVKY